MFTKVVNSEDIYELAMSFEFFYDDETLVGVNSTIEFYLESENGLVSPTYQLHVSLVGVNSNGTETNSTDASISTSPDSQNDYLTSQEIGQQQK